MSTKQTKSNAVLTPMQKAESRLDATSAALRNRLSATLAKIVDLEHQGSKAGSLVDHADVETLAAELAADPNAGEPGILARLADGDQKLTRLYVLRDALNVAIVDVSNRIGMDRLEGALAHRRATAPAWAAHQRERALTIAKLRRLNSESRAYSQSVKVSLAAEGLPCAEILMDAALLGRTEMPAGPGAYFLNQAVKAGYCTKDEIDNA